MDVKFGVEDSIDYHFLEKNTGSYCYSPCEFMDGKFSGGLYLAKKDWKKSDYKVGCKISSIRPKDLDGTTIFIRRTDEQLLKWVYFQYINACKQVPLKEQTSHLKETLTNSVTVEILRDLRSLIDVDCLEVNKSILYFSYHHLIPDASVAQRTSSTRDSRSKHKVRGLHVDNWEIPRLPIERRSLSGYKYIANFGLETRYLLFIDKSIQNIFDNTPKNDFGNMSELIINSSFASPIADWFLCNNPSYPVSRIKIEPGVCILVPVQNLIHDGDLSTKKLPDLVGMVSFNSTSSCTLGLNKPA
jgi:hypothetical protein